MKIALKDRYSVDANGGRWVIFDSKKGRQVAQSATLSEEDRRSIQTTADALNSFRPVTRLKAWVSQKKANRRARIVRKMSEAEFAAAADSRTAAA